MVLSTAVRLAAERMEDLAHIINVAIGELIRESYELPGFSTLHKEAKRGRAEVNRTLYRRVSDAIGTDGQSRIDLLLAEPDSESRKTRWDALKQNAKSPTPTQVRDLLERQRWLCMERSTVALSTLLPEVKVAAVRPCGEEFRCGPDVGDGPAEALYPCGNADRIAERACARRSRRDVYQAHDADAPAWQGGTCVGPSEASGADGRADPPAARSSLGMGR